MGQKLQGFEMSSSKPSRFTYKAFISYSHAADGMLAPKLQSGLHQFAKPWYRLRAMRVFRDETSLSNTPELWPSIEAALSQSEYFLLLASPEAAKSPWVRKEIEYWVNRRSKDKLLIILTDGCLKWDSEAKEFDWTATTALPEDVKYPFEDEPRYTDLREVKSAGQLSVRNPTFRATVADVASTLLGRNKDELIGEDVRRHRQTKRIAWSAVIALLVLTASSIFAAYVAVQNQKEAERRRLLAESRQLAVESERRRDANDIELALLLAMEALRAHDTFEARRALFEALKGNPHLNGVLQPDIGFSASGQGLAFSPDGYLLAATGNRYPVVLWDVQERRSLAPALTGELRKVVTVDFSPDGQRVAAGDGEGVVLVWDVNSRQQIGRPLTHPRKVWSVAFSQEGRSLATSSCADYDGRTCRSGEIRLWDLTRFEPHDSPLIGHEGLAQALAFSHDGELLVSGGSDGKVILWNMVTRQISGDPLEAGIGAVRTVLFSPDGEILVAVSEKGYYRRWRVATRRPIGEPSKLYQNPFISLFPNHNRKANRISNFSFGDQAPLSLNLGGQIWAAHSGLLATTNKKGAIVLVNSRSSKFPVRGSSGIDFRDPYAGNWRARPSAISSDRKTIATIAYSGKVSLRSIGANEPSVSWGTNLGWPHRSYFTPQFAFSPDGKRLAVAGCAEFQSMAERPPQDRYWRPQCVRSQVGVWEIDSKEPVIGPFSDHEAAILAMAFVPDGNRLISYGVDGSRVVRNLSTGKLSKQPPPKSDLKFGVYTFSPDGGRFAAAERDRRPEQLRIILWNHGHRKVDTPRIWRRKAPVSSLAFNPVNHTLAIGGHGGRIAQWDPESQQPVATLLQLSTFFPKSANYEVSALAFSPDGTMLASDTDRGIIVWDIASRQPLIEQKKAEGKPLLFGSEGKMLIAGSQLIDLNLASWQRQACEIVNRNLSWSEWNLYLGDEAYRKTCAGIDLAPGDLADYAEVLAERGEIDQSRKALAQAVKLAQDRGLPVNEKICATGSFLGSGEIVLAACDQAVKLCTRSWVRAKIRGQRAVARALAGDLEGAADDLQADVDGLAKRSSNAFKEKIEARREWIRKLKAGQNPFDAATRYDLRIE